MENVSVDLKRHGFISVICKTLCTIAAIVFVLAAFPKKLSADVTLKDSGERDDYRYEFYSDGELKLYGKFTEPKDIYDLFLDLDFQLKHINYLTIDLTGYDGNGRIRLRGGINNTERIAFINAVDCASIDIYISNQHTNELILPEGVDIEYLQLFEVYGIDSLDFLSGYTIDELNIGKCTDLKSFDGLSKCSVYDLRLHQMKFTNLDMSGCDATIVRLSNLNYLSDLVLPDTAAEVYIDSIYVTELNLPDNCETADIYWCNTLEKITIPSSFKYVNCGMGKNQTQRIFRYCENLTDVYYTGSRADFNDIEVNHMYSSSGSPTGFVYVTSMDTMDKVLPDGVKVHFFSGSGKGWFEDKKDNWYYLDDNLLPVTGWQKISGKWFFFDDDGIMKTGWMKSGNDWYHFDDNGHMSTQWERVEGDWYYFGESGIMRTGWQYISNAWYFFGSDGAMRKGWQYIGNTYYYFKSNGSMAANEYCEGYWLGSDGAWTYKHKATWRRNSKGWWYGDETGWYAKNETLKIDGKDYNFNAEGYCMNP